MQAISVPCWLKQASLKEVDFTQHGSCKLIAL